MRYISAISLMCALAGLPFSAARSQVSLSVGSGATLKADAVAVNLSGNLECAGRFDPGDGTLVFDGRGTQRIMSEKPQSVNNLVVRKPSGDVVLTNDLAVKSLLSVEHGYVDLDGFSLTLSPGARLEETESGRVRGALGTVTASREVRDVKDVNIGGLGLFVTTRANLGNVTLARGHIARRIRGVPGINRYYDLATARSPERDVLLLFTFDVGELNNLRPDDLVMYRSSDDGETWDSHESAVVPDSSYIRVITRQVSGLWTAGSRHLETPVMIRELAASVRQHEAVLSWTAVSQTEITGFEVQVARDDDFETIDFVEVPASTGRQDFTYTLAGLLPGRHVVRIRPVTTAGVADVSEAVEVSIGAAGAYTLSEPYPNPFQSRTAVTLTVSTTQHVLAEVFDLQGRRVSLLHDANIIAGEEMEFVFDAGSLPSGVYLFRVTGEHFSVTRRVMLVR